MCSKLTSLEFTVRGMPKNLSTEVYERALGIGSVRTLLHHGGKRRNGNADRIRVRELRS